ncbi:MAG: hypothetical protein C4560_05805 [Nitrospiraceae bacterium]|nr:MAG: hypothetical protein C4560_05805 [Nitrospiraceae bacterium]
MNNRKNTARRELQQQRLDAGFVSSHYPEVASIVINMMYDQRGTKSLSRIVNFFPGSYAFFKVACLNNDCVDGGFDLTQVITSMIRNHNKASNGNLSCESAEHSTIAYEIAIQYA